ncbi:right-handed parallel beta-helix repeat-containing protein, partial [Sphaerochaeta sp. S2]|uniref:right-handed parallel beta-helix repeat-containing protein n=1 Tax=Sphaerochaeta sp. S2 TaxID=2798868 RepID=UPI0018E9DD33
ASDTPIVITLGAGEYILPKDVTIESEVTLVGKGVESTIITYGSGTRDIVAPLAVDTPVLTINDGADFSASHLTFSYTGNLLNANVVEVLGGEASFDNCKFTGGKRASAATEEGIWMGKGLHIENDANVVVADSEFSQNEGDGITVLGSSSLAVTNSLFAHDSVALYTDTSGTVTLHDSEVCLEEPSVGMLFHNTKDVVVANNIIHKNQHGGIVFEGTSTGTIHNNRIFENTDSELTDGHGILLYDTSEATITNNTIYGHGQKGIVAGGSRATIRDNEIDDNGHFGIIVGGNCQAIIEDNSIDNSGLHGIALEANSTAEIRRNTIESSFHCGLVVEPGATALVENNSFISNTSIAIFYKSDTVGTIRNNTMRDSKTGIYHNSNVIIENNNTYENIIMETYPYPPPED